MAARPRRPARYRTRGPLDDVPCMTGTMRNAFLEELAGRPEFSLSECGSQLLINNLYTDSIESRIALFHGAEKALLFHSGWDANVSIFSTIPRPGDVLVFDELIHASMHEGMKLSATQHEVGFQHNDVKSLREALLMVRNMHEQVRRSERCVLICVESLYSMDGGVAPLKQFVAVANEVFPSGNAQFIVDEAHTAGTVGPRGSGLVCSLGLQNQIAIRVHTYGKAMASCGGGKYMLCSQ
nr:putative 8-amino-7-oxononanoate synthase [Quercus suber]